MRYIINENPDAQDFQELEQKGALGIHAPETIKDFTDTVLATYSEGGIREPKIVTVGRDRDSERGVISYHKVSPTQQLDQSGEIPHGGSVVPFVDMDIIIPGVDEGKEPQHVRGRSVITLVRGVKDKNFRKKFESLEAMSEMEASGLIKPFSEGVTGGSIEGFETNPALGLKRECAEEWGVLSEKMEGEIPHDESAVDEALMNHMPTDPAEFTPISACLDTYQKKPLLAFGFQVDVSQFLGTHIDKMREVQENNRAYMAGEKALSQWKTDGANEIVAYQINPVGMEHDFGNMRGLMQKALEESGAFEIKENDPVKEEQRLASVKKLFLDHAEKIDYTYAHEHVLVHEAEKLGIDKYRAEAQSIEVNGEVLARGDVIRYVHAHLPELQEQGLLRCSKDGVKVKLSPEHLQAMMHPPVEVDRVVNVRELNGPQVARGR